MAKGTVQDLGMEDGRFEAYAWPGGYPIVYVADDGGTICPACMAEPNIHFRGDADGWRIEGFNIHYEGPAEICANCNIEIPSAYGDPDSEEMAEFDRA